MTIIDTLKEQLAPHIGDIIVAEVSTREGETGATLTIAYPIKGKFKLNAVNSPSADLAAMCDQMMKNIAKEHPVKA